MTDHTYVYFLFFALPGFLTLFLIRYIALYKRVLTQTEFVFYSLACSVPSYLTAALIVGPPDAAASPEQAYPSVTHMIFVQGAIAALYGVAAGGVAKLALRRGVSRHTPWLAFVADAMGAPVIVYTASSQRYYGWLKRASDDDEPRREITLGDPEQINKGKPWVKMGTEMLFREDEIARISKVHLDIDSAG